MDDTSDSTNHIRNDSAIITPPHQELLPAGQKLLRILQEKSDLPPYVESKINEELNAIAETFLTKIRSAVVNLCFEDDLGDVDVDGEELELKRRKQQQLKNKSILTIIDKDWYTIEQQYERAFRLFPDVLKQSRYEEFPIRWMTYSRKEGSNGGSPLYNLQFISLVPLLTKLGIELQQFHEDQRGGLLCGRPKVDDAEELMNPLQRIVQYIRSKEENNNILMDEVFFSVWERLRKENLFKFEDIRQFQLAREYFDPLTEKDRSVFTVRNSRYLVDWDPAVLAVPLCPEAGNWLPIHFCANHKYRTVDDFIEVVRAGLKYHCQKLGHVFTTRTQSVLQIGPKEIDAKVFLPSKGTPFELACKVHGQPKIVEAVLNCFTEYCNSSFEKVDDMGGNRSTSTRDIESSLLLSAVTDASIHLDGLYILLRQNPLDALSKLHQHVSLPQYDPERTQIVTNQDNDNDDATGGKTGEKKRKYDAVGGTDGNKQH